MSNNNAQQVTTRRAYRRTDDFTPGTTKIKIASEKLPLPLAATAVLIKVHAVSLNYRDANISNGGNPWPVTPHGIICNDAAGEVIAAGDQVRHLRVGDRVAPTVDTENITGREASRSWLAADEDGVLADFIVFEEHKLAKLPAYLDWKTASMIPCAGSTAWAALKGSTIGQTVLIQGTGGVAMFAFKLARASGLRVILSSSSDAKLADIQKRYPSPPVLTVNYRTNPNWHEDVLKHTNGVGVDLVVEVGGAGTLVKSLKCTRRGGTVSAVGYLTKDGWSELDELLPLLIDRRVNLRGINASSKLELDDLCEALTAAQIQLDDIVDSVWPFEKADEALAYLWKSQMVGKIIIEI